MKTKTVLSPQTVQEIKQMYAEKDTLGRRRYTQMEIAEFFGIGETTVYRAIKSQGGYRGHREPMSELEMSKEAAASLNRMLLLNPDLAAQRSADRMAAAIAAEKEENAKGDKLLEELKGGKEG